MTPDTATVDDLLGGALKLRQPRHGYRISIDTVLLAAAIPAVPGQRVLEVGMGTGGAALALAYRCQQVHVTGLEAQPSLADFARANIALNGLDGRIDIVIGSLDQPVLNGRDRFDHVFANPPYHDPSRGEASPYADKARAHCHDHLSLADWVAFCLAHVRHKGSITFIHRADRMADLIALLAPRAGDVTLLPLWPKPGRAAKRVIIQARRGSKGGSRVLPGLVLHGHDVRYTAEAESVLRHGRALSLAPEAAPHALKKANGFA
ncbi:MAG: tRNA1(Val) (adenine(37)-N6)-methyltransferase [Rhodothalassiaceae bacterium]